jgi:hypothetical protein
MTTTPARRRRDKAGIRDTGGGVGIDGLATVLRGVDFYLFPMFQLQTQGKKCRERFYAYGKPWNRSRMYFPDFWLEMRGIYGGHKKEYSSELLEKIFSNISFYFDLDEYLGVSSRCSKMPSNTS